MPRSEVRAGSSGAASDPAASLRPWVTPRFALNPPPSRRSCSVGRAQCSRKRALFLLPGELIAGEDLHLKILSFRRYYRFIKSAVREYSANGEKKESGADNGADRHLHKEEGGEANENYCSLAGEKSARHAIANEKSDGDGENAKIVKEDVGRHHRGSDAQNRRL